MEHAITLQAAHARLVIDALRYKAHNEAGMSQEPELFNAKDTPEFALANDLEESLNQVTDVHQDIMKRAREIDKPCWTSYSGKSVEYKRAMEIRRQAAIAQAVAESDA